MPGIRISHTITVKTTDEQKELVKRFKGKNQADKPKPDRPHTSKRRR